MTGYTVIPASPGTLMIEVTLEKRRGAEAVAVATPVIAWRIPVAPDEAGRLAAVTLGGYAELFDYSTDDDIFEMPGSFVTRGFQVGAGQSVVYRCEPMERDAFELFATLELQDRRDDWIADQEQADQAPIVVDLPAQVPF